MKETELVEENIKTKDEEELQVKEENNEKQEELETDELNASIKEEKTEESKLEQPKELNIEEESIEEENQEKKKRDGLQLYTKVIIAVSIILVILAVVFSTAFALINKTNNCIVDGVTIKGINVSGLTIEETTNSLNEIFDKQIKKNINFVHSEFETSITPEQIEMDFKLQEAIDLAYSIGRTGNILKDNYDIINAKLFKIEINPAYSYNDELLTNFIASTEANLPDVVKQSTYSIDGSNLIIDKGQSGVAIDKDNFKKQIIDASTILRRRRNNY